MNVVCVVFLLFILQCRSENVTQPKCNVTLSSDVEYYDIRDYSNVDCGCEKNCIRKCCQPGFLVTTVIYQSETGNESTLECVKWTIPTAKFNVSFYDGRDLKKTKILTNYSSGVPNCTLRQYTLSENIYPQTDNRIYIHTDPKMYFDTSEICLEDYFDDKVTTPKKIVIKCLALDGVDFYFYDACMIVSCFFLLATFIVLMSQKQNKTLHTKALLFYIFNLFMAFITLLIIQLSPPFKGHFCVLVAFLCLLFFISSIFWINAICLDIYLTFSHFFGLTTDKELERKRILWYTIYAVFTPIVFILLVFLINTFADVTREFHPSIGHGSCFLRKGLPYLLYLHGPVGILLIANVTLFVLTALRIRKEKKGLTVLNHAESSKSKADKDGYVLYVTLVFAMGINWSLESIGWALEFYANTPKWLLYIPNTANMSYGVFIFFKFAWKKTWGDYLKERYYKLIGKEVENSRCSSVQTGSTTVSSNSVDSASSNIKDKQIASSNQKAGVNVSSNNTPLKKIDKQAASSNNVEKPTALSIQDDNLDVSSNNVKNETAPSNHMEKQTASTNQQANIDFSSNSMVNQTAPANNVEIHSVSPDNMQNQTVSPNNNEDQIALSDNVKNQTASTNQEANADLSFSNVENQTAPANIVENQSVPANKMENQTVSSNNIEDQVALSDNVEKQTASSNQEANVDLSSNNVENQSVPPNIMEKQIASPNKEPILDSSINSEEQTNKQD